MMNLTIYLKAILVPFCQKVAQLIIEKGIKVKDIGIHLKTKLLGMFTV
jgi:hypothetical protein